MTERLLFLQILIYFILSDESEHSKFYYPGELSNEELLQPHTYSEGIERKSNTPLKWRAKKWSHQWQYAYWLSEVGPDSNIICSGPRLFYITSSNIISSRSMLARSGSTDLAALGLHVPTSRQIFSLPPISTQSVSTYYLPPYLPA